MKDKLTHYTSTTGYEAEFPFNQFINIKESNAGGMKFEEK